MTEKFLKEIAFARSGDKGKNSNIGVVAFDEESYHLIAKQLTEEAVLHYFQDLNLIEVKRYLWPALSSLNFILVGALGDGGSVSLKLDAQGKGLGQKLLGIKIKA